MAALRLATPISDLKQRIGNVLANYSIDDDPVLIKNLHSGGAIAVLLDKVLKPDLVQTIEHIPALVHGGLFANIARGADSVMATNPALHSSNYVVAETGFRGDLDGRKLMDFVSTHLEKAPNAIVVVTAV